MTQDLTYVMRRLHRYIASIGIVRTPYLSSVQQVLIRFQTAGALEFTYTDADTPGQANGELPVQVRDEIVPILEAAGYVVMEFTWPDHLPGCNRQGF